jgi:hypothetical protein
LGFQRLWTSWPGAQPLTRPLSRCINRRVAPAGKTCLLVTCFICLTKLCYQFAGPNDASMGSRIAAGPTCSVVVDRQGMYWLAGKVHTCMSYYSFDTEMCYSGKLQATGLPANLTRLSVIFKRSCTSSSEFLYSICSYSCRTCKMSHITCGGVTLFGIGAEDGVIGWGQNAANSTTFTPTVSYHDCSLGVT